MNNGEVQHNKLIMNIFLNNIFETNILRGYGGTFLILLSALGNFQVVITIIGTMMGLLISFMALLKSIREARRATLEEEAARINLNNIKLFFNGKSSSRKKEKE